MNIIIKRSDFLTGIQSVINASAVRNTLPILSNILLETEKNTLYLSCTDLEITIRSHISAEITASGSITLPAKRLLEIIRELPEKDIHITLNDNHVVTLKCDKSVFKINGLPKDDYPVFPTVKTAEGITLSQKDLKDMIKKTIFSVSSDETRYVLNGVLMVSDPTKNIFRMVSTDGHRLSYIESTLDKKPAEALNNIIPSKALHELNKTLGEDGEVLIQLSDNQIIFSISQMVLISRLIEGQFPNFNQVIPKEYDKSITCNTGEIISATRRVALMASDKSNSINYSFSNNKLLITSNIPEVGEAQEEVEINYSGESIITAYNAKYMLDILKNIGSPECLIELTSNLNPGVIKPKDNGFNYLCVIMPMRI